MLRRLGAAGDSVGQAVLDRPLGAARRDEAGQERISRADAGDRGQGLDRGLEEVLGVSFADQRDTARCRRHDRLLGAHPDEIGQRGVEVLRLGELVADGLLGLADVGDDDRGLRLQADPHRLAVGVQQRRHPHRSQAGDQLGVMIGLGAGRKRAGDHADLRPARQVEQPLLEALEVGGRDLRPALVDLGLLPRGRIDDREVRPRVAGHLDEVVQDLFGIQQLADPRPGRAGGEAGRDHGLTEAFQRPGDVDPLTAGRAPRVDDAMTVSQRHPRHRDGAVERNVQGDGEDHSPSPPLLLRIRSWRVLILSSGSRSESRPA